VDLPELRENFDFRAGFEARLRGEPVENAPAYAASNLDVRESWLRGWCAAGHHSPEIAIAASVAR